MSQVLYLPVLLISSISSALICLFFSCPLPRLRFFYFFWKSRMIGRGLVSVYVRFCLSKSDFFLFFLKNLLMLAFCRR
uniref:Uncharacterized protein n=1 Tax=Rhizophora mucronata TaxID=61149 RepID=A0A2P2QYW4_RHIMU